MIPVGLVAGFLAVQAKLVSEHPRFARYYALEIFHLLGYRKQRVYDDVLVVSRR